MADYKYNKLLKLTPVLHSIPIVLGRGDFFVCLNIKNDFVFALFLIVLVLMLCIAIAALVLSIIITKINRFEKKLPPRIELFFSVCWTLANIYFTGWLFVMGMLTKFN